MNPIVTLVIAVAVTVVVFLLIRNIINWYNRVNERVGLMKVQNMLLKQILEELKSSKEEPTIVVEESLTVGK